MALVTGGARGLGKAMAAGLLRAGARVVVADVDNDALLAASSDPEWRLSNGRAVAVACDITRRIDCERAAERALEAFGRLDILVNNAGRGPNHVTNSAATKSLKFWEADPERWDEVIRTNVVGTFLMARAAAPHMIAAKWGRIINVTTSLSTMQRKANSPYGVSKAAIEAETLIWAQDLEGTGVTMNTLIPGGAADTEFVSPPTRQAALAGKAKLLPPSVMIPPLLWLASPLSDRVTGARFVGKLWDANERVAEAAVRAREAPVLRHAD
ncbi:MAG TPA: SDR family oxidoreductase [Alphaproteobacteria bacterium]|nr:SDR family oxidoreductase [Alphaproteobacteria bacterium]